MNPITTYFLEEFKRRDERAKVENDETRLANHRNIVGREEHNLDMLESWGRGALSGMCGSKHDFKYAIHKTVQWNLIMEDLLEHFDIPSSEEEEEEEKEEEEEETCVSCGETKTDNWYYNTTPIKNAPVCTDCREEREELADLVREKQKEIEEGLKDLEKDKDKEKEQEVRERAEEDRRGSQNYQTGSYY